MIQQVQRCHPEGERPNGTGAQSACALVRGDALVARNRHGRHGARERQRPAESPAAATLPNWEPLVLTRLPP
eukprot:scaffold138684_cov142-Phaeocystis_antarctica.AAC.1